MKSFQGPSLSRLFDQAYYDGYAIHGDLSLDIGSFTHHLEIIINKHLEKNLAQATASSFLSSLHTDDLYLSTACAQPTEVAWVRFDAVYRKLINRTIQYACLSKDTADELSLSLIGHVFLPDSSGQSRMASYDGRSSLATWLSAIINNLAIKERYRKCNNFERLDSLPDIADDSSIHKIETHIRAGRYSSIMNYSIERACEGLSEQERFILLLRYERDMNGQEIAELMGVHPSTVSRHLQHIYLKLRTEIVSALRSRYELDSSAIEECVASLLESPDCSILFLIKTH